VTKHGEDAAEKAEVEKSAREHGMTAPSFIDAGGAWCKSAGVVLEPTFLLVDKEGKLAYRHNGKLSIDDDGFKQMNALVEKM
jgi:hypothetical protein